MLCVDNRNNPQTFQKLKTVITFAINEINRGQLNRVARNMVKRDKTTFSKFV